MGKNYLEKECGMYFFIVSCSLYVQILESTHNNDLEIGSGYVYDNTLDEFNLHDTFLFSLFAFDDACICVVNMTYADNDTLGKSVYGLDLCLWSIFPFDPSEHLERGDCDLYYLILGQDDKQNLIKVVSLLSYDKRSFLGIYDLLDGPKLCIGEISNAKSCSFKRKYNDEFSILLELERRFCLSKYRYNVGSYAFLLSKSLEGPSLFFTL